jgi:protocatechuate 3,4-dioxygenase beta subunit
VNLQNSIASYFHRLGRGKKTSGSGLRCSSRDQRARLACELLETRLAPAAIVNPALTLQDPVNATNDQFGVAVAVSATNVLVGSSGASDGVAYLYGTSGQLLETYQDPNAAAGDGFGQAVALSGSNVAVGAAVGATGAGAVYLFTTFPAFSTFPSISSTTFQRPIQTFVDPDANAGDDFGASVAIWGDYVLVGAPGDGPGAAYLFTTSSPTPLVTYTDASGNTFDFGESVAGADSNLLVGARGGPNAYTGGAAFLFSTTPAHPNNPLPRQTFTDPNASATDPNAGAGDGFGHSVALAGDNVLVGAYGVNNDAGAAYLYNTGSGPWVNQTFQDPNNAPGDYFGESVALSGSSLLVGAGGASPSGNGNNLGAAYLFGTSGKLLQTFQDPNPTSQDDFGSSVALSGSNVLVGAYGTASTLVSHAGPDSGTVYLYSTGASSTALPPPPSGLAAVIRNDPTAPLDLAPFSNPYISGVALQIEWLDIEPNDPATGAQPDWTRLDELFAAADQAHKWVHLFIFSGFFSPTNWVLDPGSGVVTDDFPVPYGNSDDGPDQGVVKPLPMPYDPIYLEDWFTFLNQVSERYANNPEFLMIGAGGPTSVSEEFTLPSFPADIDHWIADRDTDGFTSTKYIQAWQQAFDVYSEDFPNQYISLSHGNGAAIDANGNAVQGVDGIANANFLAYERQAIVDEAFNTLGDQFVFQSSALNGVPGSKNQEAQQMVTGYNGIIVTGFLTATTCEGAPAAMGAPGNSPLALTLTIDNGMEQNTNGKTADYIEIHATDVEADDLQPVLRWGASLFDSADGGDHLGLSEAVSGGDVLVGEPNAADGAGAAYLYSLSGQLLQTFADPGQTTGDDFGASVAMSGSHVLVGAEGTDDGTGAGAGAVYLFSTSGGAPIAIFDDPTATAADYFGDSVALSGNNVLVGAIGANDGTGAAYLFMLPSPLPTTPLVTSTPYQTFTDPTPLPTGLPPHTTPPVDNFATSVAVSDTSVLVGAYGTNNPLNAPSNPTNPEYYVASAAYLFQISSTFGTSGEDAAETYLDPNAAANNYFASSLALSNSKVLIGAYGSNAQRGAAYLFSTSPTTPPVTSTPLQTYTDPDATDGDRFGFSLALSGNNVLIGAYGATPFNGDAGSNRGAAYLFDTSGKMLQSFQDPNGNTQDVFGFSVAMTGSNVLVGEFGAEPSSTPIPGPFSDTAQLYHTANSFSAVEGNSQSAVVEAAFSTALQVRVSDALGNPVSGALVTFTESDSPGGAGAAFNGIDTATVVSDSQGLAVAPVLTTNTSAGSFTVTASLGNISTTFLLRNLSGAPASISAAAGTPQNTPVGSTFGALLQALVTDSDNNPVANVLVTFAVPASGQTGTFNALATALTNALGIATAPPLTANHQLGSFTVTATAAGVAHHANFLLTNTKVPAAVKAVGSATQSATVNTAFNPLEVQVTDSSGKPVPNITVEFFAVNGPGGANGTFAGGTVTTNSSGDATAPAPTANTVAGTWTVNAWVAGIATPVTFTLTNTAGVATAINTFAGSPQSVTVGNAFGTALQAIVVDAFSNPVSGASVTFTVAAAANGAGGTFTGKTTVVTGANGVAKAPKLTANKVAGSFSVKATTGGLTTAPPFSLMSTPLKPHDPAGGPAQNVVVGQFDGEPLQARVSDKYGNPIAGVTVTFTAPATGAGGSFAGQRTATAITGPEGVALAPPFTANAKACRYVVTVSAPGAPSGTIAMTNLAGPAAVVRAVTGPTRTTKINGTLRTLEVQVTDAFGNVIEGAPVTFAVQADAGSGAGAAFVGGTTRTATTNDVGVAVAPPLKVNARRGAFTVTAMVPGVAEMASFRVTIE